MNMQSNLPSGLDIKFLPAADAFTQAYQASRAHSALAQAADLMFGEAGPLISGCVQTHYPEPIKDELRHLAREVGRLSDEAYANRPRYVRLTTMRALKDAIIARDGRGFYG